MSEYVIKVYLRMRKHKSLIFKKIWYTLPIFTTRGIKNKLKKRRSSASFSRPRFSWWRSRTVFIRVWILHEWCSQTNGARKEYSYSYPSECSLPKRSLDKEQKLKNRLPFSIESKEKNEKSTKKIGKITFFVDISLGSRCGSFGRRRSWGRI